MKRTAVLAICLIAFLGSLIYSIFFVKFPIDDQALKETTLTELSLSHNIKRDEAGVLAMRPGSLDREGARRPCPT